MNENEIKYVVVNSDTGKPLVLDVPLTKDQAMYIAWFEGEETNTYHRVASNVPFKFTPHVCDGYCGGCLEGKDKNRRSTYRMVAA